MFVISTAVHKFGLLKVVVNPPHSSRKVKSEIEENYGNFNHNCAGIDISSFFLRTTKYGLASTMLGHFVMLPYGR